MKSTRTLLPLLMVGLLFTPGSFAWGQPNASKVKIELDQPKIGDGLVHTVHESPLHLAGRVVAGEPVVLLMIGKDKVATTAEGSFEHDLALDKGINRVMLMAGTASGKTAYLEFNVALDVQAAIALPEAKAPIPPEPGTPTAPMSELEPRPEERNADTVAEPVLERVGQVEEQAAPANGSISRKELLGKGQPAQADVVPQRNATTPSANPKAAPTLYALVVGVSHYRYAREQDLHYAASDAAALATLLRGGACRPSDPDNIVLLQNGEARSEVIKTFLDQLLAKAGEDDIFLFYFSGHGMHDGRGQLCLLGADALVDDPHKAWSSSVTQADIMAALGAATCRQKVVLLDACRSGRVAGTSIDGQQELADVGVAFLTASRTDESSYESDELGGGIFTHYLLQGMQGAADANSDGAVGTQELATYVSAATAHAAGQKGYQQHPSFLPGTHGDLQFCTGSADGMGKKAAIAPVKSDHPQAEAATPGQGQRSKYISYTVSDGKKTLDNALFVDENTGDLIRFYGERQGRIGISASIQGEIFACNGSFPGGSMIEFADEGRANKISNGRMHLSVGWDKVEVQFSLADGKQIKARTLWRTNALPPKNIGLGQVFANQSEDQQLELYYEHNDRISLSGHIGKHLVKLEGQRFGDVLLLQDKDEAWAATFVAILEGEGSRLKGRIQFKQDGALVQVDLPAIPPVKDRNYEGARFDDPTSGQYLSFFGVNRGWVRYSGKVGDWSVEGRAQVLGDLLVYEDDSRTGFLPGRMLLHDHGQRLMTEFRLPDKNRPQTIIVPLLLFRSN